MRERGIGNIGNFGNYGNIGDIETTRWEKTFQRVFCNERERDWYWYWC